MKRQIIVIGLVTIFTALPAAFAFSNQESARENAPIEVSVQECDKTLEESIKKSVGYRELKRKSHLDHVHVPKLAPGQMGLTVEHEK